ncbi:Coenzyme F420 hydrogenase/dehydrogenase, beta subunit C-terminal domain [Rhodococcus sp. BP-316]|uniref:Coenzyme F420 hydrogenase/dehydrogenase, beta subunit C-terminal domain n=1 Tax=Rhodococcus sp. BP-316 TaxID=2739445 RepID=UPI001C9BAB46|nr:Coenzyme F420 hydrogenase/dehydrogenase, beta subunit C-terminal domain [Rhodococcus sp. BP-316]MBY6683240.1 Coenzyme F420 hydrogenase/dehydrogenase, beta subunit C-terminal domain [Rhodococcus sp. BP-316]
MDKLERVVSRVVDEGNCSGCGACAALSKRISMRLAADGFLRPVVDGDTHTVERHAVDDAYAAREFKSVCPGRIVRMPAADNRRIHPTFGPYVQAYQGHAVDGTVRHAGSSGGVLTALSSFLLESSEVSDALVARGRVADPLTTEALFLTDPRQVLETSGSRYAPVAVAAELASTSSSSVIVGKPCEIAAAHQYAELPSRADADRPVYLSFFCAGTPSQIGTEKLVAHLGFERADVVDVRYRGNGWPGDFKMTSANGTESRMSYNDSWGVHLGRDIQWRCKICVDGTGAHADVSVGDFWEADDQGFPKFDDAEGNSVVLARTPRGLELLQRAQESGVLELSAIDLDDVAKIQPLQVERRVTLSARLLGRVLAGKRVPRYTGFELMKASTSATTNQLFRAVVGTARRSLRRR